MKKLFALFGLALALALPFGGTALATDPFEEVCKPGINQGADAKTRESEVCSNESRGPNGTNPIAGDDGVLSSAVNIASIIAGAVAVIIIIIAGLQYLFAGGDSNKVTNARNAIIYAVVGLILIAISRSVIVFVINRL